MSTETASYKKRNGESSVGVMMAKPLSIETVLKRTLTRRTQLIMQVTLIGQL